MCAFFRQFLVVLSRTNGVSVTQNNYGTVFRIHGAQLGVQLIQSLLTLWLQSCFVEVEQHVRLQSETLGFNNWSRSWSWSNWSNYVILTEAVRNARAQHGVVWTCANGTCVTDVAYELVVRAGSPVFGQCVFNTNSSQRRNAGVVVAQTLTSAAVVSFGVCTPYHTTQTSVDIQIVSNWVAQFSSQLNALRFESTVVHAAFVRHTAEPVIAQFEARIGLHGSPERAGTQLIFVGWAVADTVLVTVAVETSVVVLGPAQFSTGVPCYLLERLALR